MTGSETVTAGLRMRLQFSTPIAYIGSHPMTENTVSMQIDALPTPSLILDRGRLLNNINRMKQKAESLGVALRPHLKTAKSAAVATLATDGMRGGITVSTLKEAEYFADHGFQDITYAVGIVPAKLDQAAALLNRGVDLKLVTDSPEAAGAVATHGAPFKLLAEIDCGDHRAGVQADGDTLTAIGNAMKGSKSAKLIGVLTHAGHSYGVDTIAKIEDIAEQERAAAVLAADRLRADGHPISIVSAGSTPTALYMKDAAGLTELRPGVYVFFDLDQQSRGVCAETDIAVSVLASVIGHNRAAGKILLDSGGLALSKDTGANAFRPEVGYGAVCDAETAEPIPGLFVSGVSQEHGHVKVPDDSAYDRLPVGTLVRILPNHACMTAAAYEQYHVLNDAQIVETWDRVNGW